MAKRPVRAAGARVGQIAIERRTAFAGRVVLLPCRVHKGISICQAMMDCGYLLLSYA